MAWLDNFVDNWNSNEASGDLIGVLGNTMTDTNTVASATGKIGGGRDFESANSEYFIIADNAALSMGDIDMSGFLWVKLESTSATQIVLCKGQDVNSTTTLDYALYYSSSAARFIWVVCSSGGTRTQVNANALGAPSAGTWYGIRYFHDSVANQIGIQVNNGSINTASHSAGIRDGTGPFRFGWDDIAGRYLDAVLDEASLWKRLLTTDEATALVNGGNGFPYPYGNPWNAYHQAA